MTKANINKGNDKKLTDESKNGFYNTLITTFSAVFIAELGDKTHLAPVALSGTSNKPMAVFIGSSGALLLATLIGALAGGSIASIIPGNLLKLFAGLGLLFIGIKILWPLIKSPLKYDGDSN